MDTNVERYGVPDVVATTPAPLETPPRARARWLQSGPRPLPGYGIVGPVGV
jgi:hypothetical protein